MRRAAVAALIVAAAFGLGACGDSPEDQAYDNGAKLGTAVRELFDSSNVEQADKAISHVKGAIKDMGSEARKHVEDQVEAQRSNLESAVGGGPEQFRSAVGDIRAQAEAFRHTNNSITNEFWRGFEDGYDEDE